MKVWSAIFNLIALLIIALMIFTIHRIDAVNERQFEEIRLSYAIDYATEAAFRATITTDTIATDYSNGGLEEVALNPSMTLPTFYNVLALSYDISLDEEMQAIMEQSIATGFLCAVDGYYILEPIEYDSDPYDYEIGGEYKLSFGVKRPYIVYTYEDNDPNSARLFTVSLVNEKNVEFLPEFSDDTGEEPLKIRNTYAGTNLTEEIVKQSIGKLLTEDVNYAIHARNLTNIYGAINTFYVPSDDSMTAVNDITSPSLAIIFQDSSFLNGYDMDVVSIGGVKVQPRSNVITFKLPGDDTLYYCYAGQQLGTTFMTGEPKYQVKESDLWGRYSTIKEAILDSSKRYGEYCHPHMKYLQEPYGRAYENK